MVDWKVSSFDVRWQMPRIRSLNADPGHILPSSSINTSGNGWITLEEKSASGSGSKFPGRKAEHARLLTFINGRRKRKRIEGENAKDSVLTC